ncbi:MAG: hypothetical protein V1702_05645 [Candidatus Woesearchaeota archaeon]
MKRKARNVSVSQDRTAMLLFIVFLLAVIFFLDAASSSEQAASSEEIVGKLVVSGNEQSSIAFVVRDRVDTAKLMEFANKDYNQLKEELGVSDDFTVYFEDEQGNLVPVGDKYCIGSSRASVSGFACG